MARGLEAQRLENRRQKAVKNVDLWQALDALVAQHQIEWQWIKGHSGHPGNEMADQLANEAIAELRAKG